MTDTLSPEQRSRLMSQVRGKDTKPEWVLRSGLHRLGFRYRLHRRDLPGKPDLVLSKYHSVIFVHGCFWHRHPGCAKASMPKSNTDFWEQKFRSNVERDRRQCEELRKAGWRVIVVWQCELYRQPAEVVERVAEALLASSKGDGPRFCYAGALRRDTLLQVAEKKVRYRLRKGLNDQ